MGLGRYNGGNKLRLVLLGSPGSGKGTMRDLIAQHYNLKTIIVGDIVKQEIRDGTKLGQLMYKYTTEGKLVPDEFVMDLIVRQCEDVDNYNGYIIDSAPLSLEQMEVFSQKIDIDYAIYLKINNYEIVRKRTALRVVCPNCKAVSSVVEAEDGLCDRCGAHLERRYDDNPQTVETRIQRFISETIPVINELERKGKVITINAELSKDAVFNEIIQKLDNFFKKSTLK